MATVKFVKRQNARRLTENFVEGLHLSLPEIKKYLPKTSHMQNYVSKEDIPPYPNPVEFVVANVSHVTDYTGCTGILKSQRFKPPGSDELWWNLHITDDEIQSAEKRFLEIKPPQFESKRKTKLLKKFTTSPLFKLEESRFGNYRFVFPLVELMNAYREQNCGGQEPVVRIYETITYKQEIVYSVLIHSPEDNEEFKKNPPLTKSKWVSYEAKQDAKEIQDTKTVNQETKDGKIIWKAQAICETHWYELLPELKARKVRKNREQFYVWDQVSLVFHLPGSKALDFPRARLIKALEACKQGFPNLAKYNYRIKNKDDEVMNNFEKAKEFVNQLKQELEDETKKANVVKIKLEAQEMGVPLKTESAEVKDNSKKRRQKTETSRKSKAIKLEKAVKSENSDSFNLRIHNQL